MKNLLALILSVAILFFIIECSPFEDAIEAMPSETADINWQEVDKALHSDIHLVRWEDSNWKPPVEGRDCSDDDWRKAKVEKSTMYYSTFYVESWTIATGKEKGLWHNPEGDFARIFYRTDGTRFLEASYNKGISEDVVQKVGKGKNAIEVRFPAEIRRKDGFISFKHKRNTWEHDVDPDNGKYGMYIIEVETGNVVCVGSFKCDVLISGQECYL